MRSWAQVDSRHAWEDRFVNALKWLASALGRGYRSRRDGDDPATNLIADIRDKCLPLITFTLDDRMRWEDSYQLPEELFPHVLLLLGELVGTFAPNAASDLAALFSPVTGGTYKMGLAGWDPATRKITSTPVYTGSETVATGGAGTARARALAS